MRTIDLVDFITEARLGYIKLGSSKTDVVRVFGKGKQRKKWAKSDRIEEMAWIYNDLYFGFDPLTELVCVIGFKGGMSRDISIGKNSLITHEIRFGMDVDSFEALLKNQEAEFKEKLQWDENGWDLEFESGVLVSFQGQTDGSAPLVELAIESIFN